jgi:hypothetical protein
LINAARNTGGSIGISLISNVLLRRTSCGGRPTPLHKLQRTERV